jgi:hypothetical protein
MLLSFRHLWNIRVAVFDQRYQNSRQQRVIIYVMPQTTHKHVYVS